MKTILALLLTFGVLSCSETEKSSDPDPEQEVQAMLNSNWLPADGCETHVTLNWEDPQKQIRYAPDAESVAKVENFVGPQTYQKQGTIKFRLTGRKKTVQCGWGSKFEADEITVISIR
ncbi:hypothetical protein [Larkinella soli]|uniref:hypothetical protein n=1 Tax=Larkinella soli TaxID=1770527 RepID=UPI000FFBAE72|nr:hypothetical protein [Larkinella soli]